MSRKLFIPVLRELGFDAGFSLRNPIAFGYKAAKSVHVKITLFRDSKIACTRFVEFQGDSAYLLSTENDWNLPSGSTLAGDFVTAEFVTDSHGPLPVEFGCEAQLIYQSAAGARASVLLDMVPVRGKGHKYAPIFHNGHYMLSSEAFETYMCFTNFNVDQTENSSAAGNEFEFRVLSHGGETLSTYKRSLPYNATALLPVSEFAKETGNKPVTILARGGASQFAIFSVFQNRSRHGIGIEHSLPPIYYTDAVKNPETRKIFYQKAFGNLWN